MKKVNLFRYFCAYLLDCSAANSVRHIYSDKKLKIDRFKARREKLRISYLDTKEDTIRSTAWQMTQHLSKVNLNNLKKLLVLADKPDEVQVLVDLIKHSVRSNLISPVETRGVLLEAVRLVYVLDQIDLGLQLTRDEVLQSFIRGTYAVLFLMNKLLIKGRLQEVVDLFFEQIDSYDISTSYSEDSYQATKQIVPFDQLGLTVEALYQQVFLFDT